MLTFTTVKLRQPKELYRPHLVDSEDRDLAGRVIANFTFTFSCNVITFCDIKNFSKVLLQSGLGWTAKTEGGAGSRYRVSSL